MSRTGTQENKQANADYSGQSNEAYHTGKLSIADYIAAQSKLARGENIGADPFKNAGYLANENRLQANAVDANAGATRGAISRWNRQTGGLNSGVTGYTLKDLDLDKMRMGDQLTSERAANDYRSNLDWQRYLAEAKLQPANAASGFYGTSTGGRGTANSNLTQLGMASYGPWNSAIQAIGGAASAALGKKGS